MEVSGTCYMMFAYDVGQAIDLDVAATIVAELRRRMPLGHKRRAPPWAGDMSGPLILTQATQEIDLGIAMTDPQVELVLYEFGAVSVTYSIPVRGSLENQVELSAMLSEATALADDSRQRVENLRSTVHKAVQKPMLAAPVEDYVVFSLQPPTGFETASLWNEHGTILARILRGERGTLSSQETTDALAQRISYGPNDATLVDWHAALLMGDDTSEERWILEHANVELLELRILDAKLDHSLDEAYNLISKPDRILSKPWRSEGRNLRRIARLQTDTAILYEGVNNAFKLLGDQYLARLYRSTSGRLHLPEWDASIERKMRTLDSIYQKISDRGEAWRLEALEWIIIVLITIELLPAFFPGLFHK